MKYQIYGDQAVENVFDITMSPCKDFSSFYLGEEDYGNPLDKALIQAHIDAEQFFCPDAFDLTLYGMKGDLKAKILSIELDSVVSLENRSILLLLNNGKIDYQTDQANPTVQKYTSYHWLPISMTSPQTSTITFKRKELVKPLTEAGRILGLSQERETFHYASDTDVKYTPYS